MIPHDPVIDPDGGRRCDYPIRKGHRCNLLEEEHPPILWRASFESRSFSFEAYGESEDDARAAMGRTLRAHQRQYRLDRGWARDMLDPDAGNVGIYPIAVGHGYRDGERITR